MATITVSIEIPEEVSASLNEMIQSQCYDRERLFEKLLRCKLYEKIDWYLNTKSSLGKRATYRHLPGSKF